jgi:hypothetical protein
MHTFWCRKSLKKKLVSAQNLENKGTGIFLPPRPMVLKVVTGKILETLKLSWGLTAPGSLLKLGKDWNREQAFGFTMMVVGRQWERPRSCAHDQIVKDRMLSHR